MTSCESTFLSVRSVSGPRCQGLAVPLSLSQSVDEATARRLFVYLPATAGHHTEFEQPVAVNCCIREALPSYLPAVSIL